MATVAGGSLFKGAGRPSWPALICPTAAMACFLPYTVW